MGTRRITATETAVVKGEINNSGITGIQSRITQTVIQEVIQVIITTECQTE